MRKVSKSNFKWSYYTYHLIDANTGLQVDESDDLIYINSRYLVLTHESEHSYFIQRQHHVATII